MPHYLGAHLSDDQAADLIDRHALHLHANRSVRALCARPRTGRKDLLAFLQRTKYLRKYLQDRHVIHTEKDVAARDAAACVRGRAFDQVLHDARRQMATSCTPAPQIISAAYPHAAMSLRETWRSPES